MKQKCPIEITIMKGEEREEGNILYGLRVSGWRSLLSADRLRVRGGLGLLLLLRPLTSCHTPPRPNQTLSQWRLHRPGRLFSRLEEVSLISETCGLERPWGTFTPAARMSVSSSQVTNLEQVTMQEIFLLTDAGGRWAGWVGANWQLAGAEKRIRIEQLLCTLMHSDADCRVKL